MSDFDKLKEILAEQLGVDEDSITAQTTIDDLGADSLDLVEAVMNIEEAFGVNIDDDEIENLKTVGDFLDYIANK
ncbi:MAG: acyl carrier protein [Clostridia bacterium]|nr:acyl carrier protein [Clostridia bacterium]